MGLRAPVRFLILAAFVVLGTGSTSEEMLHCEEAARHLADCCPQLALSTISCGGACSNADLGAERSLCLLGLDCATLRARGACAYAGSGVEDAWSSPDADVPRPLAGCP